MSNNRRNRYRRRKQAIRVFSAVLVVFIAVVGFMFWSNSKQPATTTPAAETPSTEATTPSDEPVEEADEELRQAVEQFVRFYESPASPKRTLMLNSFCGSPEICSLLVGVDEVDTSEAAQGSMGTKLHVANSEPNKFESSNLDESRVKVLSTTYLRVLPPNELPYTVSASYETAWIERELDGWKLVGILTQ